MVCNVIWPQQQQCVYSLCGLLIILIYRVWVGEKKVHKLVLISFTHSGPLPEILSRTFGDPVHSFVFEAAARSLSNSMLWPGTAIFATRHCHNPWRWLRGCIAPATNRLLSDVSYFMALENHSSPPKKRPSRLCTSLSNTHAKVNVDGISSCWEKPRDGQRFLHL